MGESPDVKTAGEGPNWIAWGALFGAIAVGAGAFGAHGLKSLVTPDRLQVFETAVRYQVIHALALLVVGLLSSGSTDRRLAWAGRSMTVGIVVFSGSLYLLVLTDTAWLGAITPLGGVSFIAGWLFLAAWAVSRRRLPRTGA
jgi:uncharacterized membrane protein YgdD (TMEM256/DUF423 family)